MKADLSSFSNRDFDRGASKAREFIWILVSLVLFQVFPFKVSRLKCWVLRRFGAKVGHGVVIKPQVKITFPWKLTIGNHVWLGEECWLLNLDRIVLGNDVCISQRAFLCTGSHNYKVPSFDLLLKPIVVEDGAWIGAGCWVGPGSTIGNHAVLTAGSVTSHALEPFGIYGGNPATFIRPRILSVKASDV